MNYPDNSAGLRGRRLLQATIAIVIALELFAESDPHSRAT